MIKLQGLSKIYHTPAGDYAALRSIDLQIAVGEFVAIVGKSGSGKSTLLNLVGGIDSPTSGTVEIGGTAIQDLDQSRLAAWRGRNVGFVFQFFQLLPTLTVLENVELPLLLGGIASTAGPALDRLRWVGLEEKSAAMPHQLSGGQMQRVAIARALVASPEILIADEPTGNLDTASGDQVLQLLRDSAVRFGATVLLATHSAEAASIAGTRVRLRDGRVAEIERS